MQAFAALLDNLVNAQSRNRKLALLGAYFRATPDPDRGIALAVLTDGLSLRLPLRRILTDLMASHVDPVLYKLSRDYVGDTAETVALLWPDPVGASARTPSLSDIVGVFGTATSAETPAILSGLLDRLDSRGRWALLKMLGGAPRVGVSARLAKTALADAFAKPVAELEEIWHALAPPYTDLFDWLDGRAERPDPGSRPVFRPVMLAHPIEDADWAGLAADDFAAEWKWDGIRVQIAAIGGECRIFSRAGDDVARSFPEIEAAFRGFNAVLDGELLIVRDGEIAPFNDLQQRLNRKTVSSRMLADYPAHVRLYDLLIDNGDDIRSLALTERRARLETWYALNKPDRADLSEFVTFSTFEDLNEIWGATRSAGIEGLMLKRRAGPYLAGRPKGHWFKWKRAALTLDCVLMYAQRGSGKRSSFYSDYTFGVWNDEADADTGLPLPIGKAYSGFTDEELRRLDRFIRDNTTERFGPVRAVKPTLVLEIAFDALYVSSRHKSGIAMRFPRVHRIRWDKPAAEADTLAVARALIDTAASRMTVAAN